MLTSFTELHGVDGLKLEVKGDLSNQSVAQYTPPPPYTPGQGELSPPTLIPEDPHTPPPPPHTPENVDLTLPRRRRPGSGKYTFSGVWRGGDPGP